MHSNCRINKKKSTYNNFSELIKTLLRNLKISDKRKLMQNKNHIFKPVVYEKSYHVVLEKKYILMINQKEKRKIQTFSSIMIKTHNLNSTVFSFKIFDTL